MERFPNPAILISANHPIDRYSQTLLHIDDLLLDHIGLLLTDEGSIGGSDKSSCDHKSDQQFDESDSILFS